ncbi:organoarsenical effux MFS transporter ArsJ [Moritella viscosa]|uniref:Putative membrane protein n=1 Tax=Moritella viscosa TaxID=80854 RepID=A0A1L0BTV1_9GAMM|nr:organoarsenical effux MFS transporter ArsJ [Moritella viscosa]SGZ01860.1 Putative membrane protein [Moritella viscosa]SGZ08713.1 Putative membrane protein [Moritella viscosa]SHO10607.1 Putative membrane protein [Moritella viscosa]SHO10610.1 Putative membrane protein [Moritella viscosa]SHO15780.1 Putative membrane protein [Moritella viscosa]
MIKALAGISPQIKQYLIITGNYWAFTLTDGALRMLVVLYFHQLGYSPINIAMLFVFYEVFGVITNLIGGWLGARLGLNKTMNIGLGMQIVALMMLTVPADMLTVVYVMVAQALSGIAKDLNKMSAKSAIKLLVPKGNDDSGSNKLYHWVAVLTGSKNALKGVGFFLGGVLLTTLGFQGAIQLMAAMLSVVWFWSLISLKAELGKAKNKPKFTEIFSKSSSINLLSAARLFLFGARDVWFVVALPVFLATSFNWDHWWVGSFMASWVIGYGMVQSIAPQFTGKSPSPRSAARWASYLATIPVLIAIALHYQFYVQFSIIVGLLIFGGLFAINSSLHSYLIVSLASSDGVSMDVGFYYMANAMGRLIGTVLSGWVFQVYGLEMCLWISALFISLSAIIALKLKDSPTS